VWHFTCSDTFAARQSCHVCRAVTAAGAVAAEADGKKKLNYSHLSRIRFTSQSLSVESVGTRDEDAVEFLRELGGSTADVTHEQRSTGFY